MEKTDYLHRSFQSVTSAMSVLASRFDNISLPIKGSFFYDLIVEKEFSLYRVKVIFTDCKQPSGSYIANIRKSGGYENKKETKEPFNTKFCDFLFIETPIEKYFIPTSEINTKRSLTLSQFIKYKVAP